MSGHILKNDLGYDHLCLPMEFDPGHRYRNVTRINFTDPRTEEGELLWPERFPIHSVNELKRSLSSWGGTYAVSGQLQQTPVPRGGGMFKRDWFTIVDRGPDPSEVTQRVRGWDFASTKTLGNPRTAGVRLARTRSGRLYVEHALAGHWGPLEVEQKLVETAASDGYATVVDFPQDPGQAGKSQVANFVSKLHGFDVRFSPESGSKDDRARPFAAQAEAGNVFLVRGNWNESYLDELENFPRGQYKDQVDGTSRAYARMIVPSGQTAGEAPRVFVVEGAEY